MQYRFRCCGCAGDECLSTHVRSSTSSISKMISCSMEHRRITKYGVTTRAVRTVYYQSAVNIQQALYKTETCSRHARANTRKLRSIGRYKRGSLSCSMEHDAVNVAANSTCDVNERGGKQQHGGVVWRAYLYTLRAMGS